jgi:hypothetical protein
MASACAVALIHLTRRERNAYLLHLFSLKN